MNILFVYPTIFNPIKGGVERVTFLLAKEFVRRGHKIHFLHNYHSDPIDFPFEVKLEYFPFEEYSDTGNIEWYHNYLNHNNIDIVINQCGQFGDSTLYCNTGGYSKVISVAHMSPEINLNCLFGEIPFQMKNLTILLGLRLLGVRSILLRNWDIEQKIWGLPQVK